MYFKCLQHHQAQTFSVYINCLVQAVDQHMWVSMHAMRSLLVVASWRFWWFCCFLWLYCTFVCIPAEVQSVAFSGIAGYAIGVAWLLVGLLLALFLCCKYCCTCCCGCCRRPKSDIPHSGFYYWLPRILVLLLSLIALYVSGSLCSC
jgi:hypothetical protein